MASPVDAAPETLRPRIEQPIVTAPDENEAAGLNDGFREIAPPDESNRADSEFAQSPAEEFDTNTEDHHQADSDEAPVADGDTEPATEIPKVEAGRLSLRDLGYDGGEEHDAEAQHGPSTDNEAEGRLPKAAAADKLAGKLSLTQTLERGTEEDLAARGDASQMPGHEITDRVDDNHGRKKEIEAPVARGEPAAEDGPPEPETDAAQPPGPPDNGDIPPPAADDLPDKEGDDQPERPFHVSEIREAPKIINEDGKARVLTAEEVATRSLLVPRGTFVTSGKLAERFGLSEIQAKNLATEVTEERTLLSRRIIDPEEPEAPTRFGYSYRYLDAVETYKVLEDIEQVRDAITEVANEEWGQYLAWGIRAEYHDAVRALGSHLLLNEAMEVTGMRRIALFDRDLPEYRDPPRGKRGAWVIPVEKLIERERWLHRGFDQLKRGPEPVQFYSTREVADMLDQKYASTIRKMIGLNLLPGVFLDAPFRDGAERQQRNTYVRIPAPDAKALRDYWEGNQRKTLRAVVRSFILDNPNQFTVTRGRFEAYADQLRRAGQLRYKSDVERLLGTSDKFLEHYNLPSGQDAFLAITWNRIQTPASRRVSEIDARTVRSALSEVVEKGRSPAEVAETYGVSLRSVYNWMKAATQGRI